MQMPEGYFTYNCKKEDTRAELELEPATSECD